MGSVNIQWETCKVTLVLWRDLHFIHEYLTHVRDRRVEGGRTWGWPVWPRNSVITYRNWKVRFCRNPATVLDEGGDMAICPSTTQHYKLMALSLLYVCLHCQIQPTTTDRTTPSHGTTSPLSRRTTLTATSFHTLTDTIRQGVGVLLGSRSGWETIEK